MSGGEVFVYDPDDLLKLRFNPDLVAAGRLDQNQADRLRGHVGRHEEFTASELATRLLDRWEETVEQFWRIAPKANVARLEEEHEGTVTAP
jgi:glutamate synthase domain-containing protein 3